MAYNAGGGPLAAGSKVYFASGNRYNPGGPMLFGVAKVTRRFVSLFMNSLTGGSPVPTTGQIWPRGNRGV